MNARELAEQVMARIEELGRISEEPGRLTRTFGSSAMRQANDLVASWMSATGMSVAIDAIGNLIGRYAGPEEGAKTFLLGSHLDTVRDAGKFDGPLGVLIAIACVVRLHQSKIRLPFQIEIIGFADEEGVRYQTTYLGSKAFSGCFNEADLKRLDAGGVSLADAIRNFGGDPDRLDSARREPRKLLGYVETHIEQGPVLEKRGLPVGVVTAIAGQTRIKARFTGRAEHAGTTPMNLRQDALAAAAKFISAVEEVARGVSGLVATVGQIEARPGASNVIPGETVLSVDVRHAVDSTRLAACRRLEELAWEIGEPRGIAVRWEIVHEASSAPCSPVLSAQLATAVGKHLPEVLELPSGAGHDAAVLAGITPVAMLFVRCRSGISHHPDESVLVDDVRVAIEVLDDFLDSVALDSSPH